MYLQEAESVFDLQWNKDLTYRDVYHQNEVQFSKYNFEAADTDMLFELFKIYEAEAKRLCEMGLYLPSYDYTLKSSHTFNLLEARNAVSVTERTSYIARVRALAKMVAAGYVSDELNI
jgi:glycyl-tRNA synthetase alpha chain